MGRPRSCNQSTRSQSIAGEQRSQRLRALVLLRKARRPLCALGLSSLVDDVEALVAAPALPCLLHSFQHLKRNPQTGFCVRPCLEDKLGSHMSQSSFVARGARARAAPNLYAANSPIHNREHRPTRYKRDRTLCVETSCAVAISFGGGEAD